VREKLLRHGPRLRQRNMLYVILAHTSVWLANEGSQQMRIESTKMLDIERVLRKRSKLLRRNMLHFWIRMLRQRVLQSKWRMHQRIVW
jgi:hypothetical protein